MKSFRSINAAPHKFGTAVMALLATLAMPVASMGTTVPPAMELRWDNLVPPAPPKPPKAFFDGRTGPYEINSTGSPNDPPPPPPRPEAKWLSEKSARITSPAEIVTGLDGKRVHIGGYVVPLDFDATHIKEFLLVPFVGACIHVPPPPANQIIYVKADKGFDVKGQFDPVYVTGTMRTLPTSTGLADAGYSIDAEQIDDRSK